MKTFLSAVLILMSTYSLASTTCPQGTKRVVSCHSVEGTQYDICRKPNLGRYQLRVNGEVYSLNASRSVIDGVISFEGVNYNRDRFILELINKKRAVLTEVNQYEMPIGESVELECEE